MTTTTNTFPLHRILIDVPNREASIDGHPIHLSADDIITTSQDTSGHIITVNLPILCNAFEFTGDKQ